MGRGRMVSGGGRGSRVSVGSRGARVSVGGGRSGLPRHAAIVLHTGHGYPGGNNPLVGIIVGSIIVAIGIFVFFVGVVNSAYPYEYSTVEAECVNNKYIGGGYFACYEYEVDGVFYSNRSNQAWEEPEKPGKIVVIYYLESDPNQIYEEKPETPDSDWSIFLASFICIGVGIIPIIIFSKKLKEKKQQEDAEANEPALEDTQYRCLYCGSKYDKSLGSCPKCGASRIE